MKRYIAIILFICLIIILNGCTSNPCYKACKLMQKHEEWKTDVGDYEVIEGECRSLPDIYSMFEDNDAIGCVIGFPLCPNENICTGSKELCDCKLDNGKFLSEIMFPQ